MDKLNRKQFDQKISDLIASIKTNAVPFPDDSPEARVTRLSNARKDFFFFCQTYFPHYFTLPFCPDHHRVYDGLTADSITAVIGFRGFGKSVMLAIALPIWSALTERSHFAINIAANEELAKERTVAIQCEFLYNSRLISDYGEQLRAVGAAESDFITRNDTRFLALGYKQGVRGKIHKRHRPDLIVLDDLEDDKATSEKVAEAKLKFVREEAYGALAKHGKIIWLGNLTHKISALNKFVAVCQAEPDNPALRYFIINAVQADGSPTWPANFDAAKLANFRSAMGNVGFQRHMMNVPVVEGLVFRTEWLRYHETPMPSASADIVRFGSGLNLITYADPSWSARGDYKTVVTIGLINGKYRIFHLWCRKATIDDMIRAMYDIDLRFHTRIWMESNFCQSFLWEWIPKFAAEFGYLLPVSGYENRLNKVDRILKIQPLYQWGWIEHPLPRNADLDNLEEQLINFPDYQYDDAPDAVASAIQILSARQTQNEYQSVAKRFATRFSNIW